MFQYENGTIPEKMHVTGNDLVLVRPKAKM